MQNQLKFRMITIIFILNVVTNDAHELPPKIKTGTYGLCNCKTNNTGSPNLLKLTINSDSTFNYIDNTNPKKEFHTTGKWVIRGKK